jgi:hypothetical protein
MSRRLLSQHIRVNDVVPESLTPQFEPRDLHSAFRANLSVSLEPSTAALSAEMFDQVLRQQINHP